MEHIHTMSQLAQYKQAITQGSSAQWVAFKDKFTSWCNLHSIKLWLWLKVYTQHVHGALRRLFGQLNICLLHFNLFFPFFKNFFSFIKLPGKISQIEMSPNRIIRINRFLSKFLQLKQNFLFSNHMVGFFLFCF